MKRAAILVLLAACSAPPEKPAPPPAAPSTATTPRASTPPPAAAPASAPVLREIYIDSVEVANPLVVRGRARTFENNVVLRVRDARGGTIVEDFTTSDGEMGRHNPFEAHLWVVRDPGGRVTVEAFEYSAKDGSVRSLASRDVTYDVATIPAKLVFPAGDCTKFAAFTRAIPKSVAMARLLVEALLAGPTSAERGATPPFPKGSGVRSVILRDGEVTVDFNERLQNVGGACAASAIRESVTRTLRELPGVRSVVITAGGSKELALQP